MIQSINDFDNAFFIGVAGTGMSAIAQYLAGIGKNCSGSDRYFKPGEANDTKTKLTEALENTEISTEVFIEIGRAHV